MYLTNSNEIPDSVKSQLVKDAHMDGCTWDLSVGKDEKTYAWAFYVENRRFSPAGVDGYKEVATVHACPLANDDDLMDFMTACANYRDMYCWSKWLNGWWPKRFTADCGHAKCRMMNARGVWCTACSGEEMRVTDLLPEILSHDDLTKECRTFHDVVLDGSYPLTAQSEKFAKDYSCAADSLRNLGDNVKSLEDRWNAAKTALDEQTSFVKRYADVHQEYVRLKQSAKEREEDRLRRLQEMKNEKLEEVHKLEEQLKSLKKSLQDIDDDVYDDLCS